MGASSSEGVGQGSAEGPLRGFSLNNSHKIVQKNLVRTITDTNGQKIVFRGVAASDVDFDDTGLTFISADNVQNALEDLDLAISSITAGDVVIANGAVRNRVIYNETTNTTATELFVDGDGSTRLIIADDTSWTFSIYIVAKRTDASGESAGYKYEGVIDRQSGAGTTALVGTISETIFAEDSSPWSVTVMADTTNGSLKVEVTGEAGKDISWLGRVELSEVFN